MTKELAIESVITEAFSSYRSEWMKDLHSYYTEPRYFPELVTHRPCFLIGGRGTGKTTVLKSMAYTYQREEGGGVASKDYFGVYHKFEIGIANSFHGKGVSDEDWIHLFEHYLNLRICLMTLELLKDLVSDGIVNNNDFDLAPMLASLGIELSADIKGVFDGLRLEISRFSRVVNNPRLASGTETSILNMPISELFYSIASSGILHEKFFYLIFDEFENLHNWQQKIFNTLVKHCGGNFVYKVGSKRNGIKTKYTSANNEPLFSPQDYAKIDIDERVSTSEFSEFAAKVCDIRLGRIQKGSSHDRCPETRIKNLLEKLDMDSEAIKLGVDKENKIISEALLRLTKVANIDLISKLTELQKFYLSYLVEKNSSSLEGELTHFLTNRNQWIVNYENYKFDLLFKIRKGKVGISKYYNGWETYISLSGNNIRFILMLLESTLLRSVKNNDGRLPAVIDADTQTKSCKSVAQSVFDEVAGLSYDGPQYQNVVLAFGKLFGYFASSIIKKTPELNQFNIEDLATNESTEDFIRSCVMHYVLLEARETKQTKRDEVSEYDYSLHPIFAPKFSFSSRKGRKFNITTETFNKLIDAPEAGVKAMIHDSKGKNEQSGLFD
ncbi:ORC-CDC6 family AAA ATPase [Deinococcus marmoris]|uniref:Uncharacterized protein n=1 Tax=Deinococcus marmoris TaxID=249408 RepID=A0A1U7NZN9_9DEIO|nr:hypothetical protein [Deinococcus marmoris]OLV18378.1 hypothetical protein BOO71_0006229 [Deinococcus marmoris]